MLGNHVLSWATFLPLAGAILIVVLVGLRFVLGFSKKTMDDAARAITLVASGLSFVAAIAAWRA